MTENPQIQETIERMERKVKELREKGAYESASLLESYLIWVKKVSQGISEIDPKLLPLLANLVQTTFDNYSYRGDIDRIPLEVIEEYIETRKNLRASSNILEYLSKKEMIPAIREIVRYVKNYIKLRKDVWKLRNTMEYLSRKEVISSMRRMFEMIESGNFITFLGGDAYHMHFYPISFYYTETEEGRREWWKMERESRRYQAAYFHIRRAIEELLESPVRKKKQFERYVGLRE
jgi:hypothetical protein